MTTTDVLPPAPAQVRKDIDERLNAPRGDKLLRIAHKLIPGKTYSPIPDTFGEFVADVKEARRAHKHQIDALLADFATPLGNVIADEIIEHVVPNLLNPKHLDVVRSLLADESLQAAIAQNEEPAIVTLYIRQKLVDAEVMP